MNLADAGAARGIAQMTAKIVLCAGEHADPGGYAERRKRGSPDLRNAGTTDRNSIVPWFDSFSESVG
jgi:hypothetical protein